MIMWEKHLHVELVDLTFWGACGAVRSSRQQTTSATACNLCCHSPPGLPPAGSTGRDFSDTFPSCFLLAHRRHKDRSASNTSDPHRQHQLTGRRPCTSGFSPRPNRSTGRYITGKTMCYSFLFLICTCSCTPCTPIIVLV